MAYFTQDFIDYFAELKENNVREWFEENKKRYEKSVKNPFKKLVADLIIRMNEIDPEIQVEPKHCIFRIYRDVRFSKDKTPYKTHVSAAISRGGRKDMRSPGMYLQMNDADVRLYSGVYMPDKEDLINIRTAIAENPEEFEALLNDAKFKKVFGGIQGEKNKRIPKEFVEPAERQPLIYNKQFYYFTKMDPQMALEDNLPEFLMEKHLVGRPMAEFLADAIGVS